MKYSLLRIVARPLKKYFYKVRYAKLVQKTGLPLYELGEDEKRGAELVWSDIVRQLQSSTNWLNHVIYPIGGAASPAFIGVLSRILIENKLSTIIEFGVGQTSKVLSNWAKETGGQVFSIEHDSYWANECRQELEHDSHEIIYAPLKVGSSGYTWYDESAIMRSLDGQRADLIIVDGPIGTARWSRAGIIDFFDNLHKDDWIVLWDDLHRYGDLESFSEFVHSKNISSGSIDVSFCQAFRTLGLVFTDKYRSLKYIT